MNKTPQELLELRNTLRKQGKYEEADEVRNTLNTLGYEIRDKNDGTTEIIKVTSQTSENPKRKNLVVFGSGELSSVGRKIHESLIEGFNPPVKIALLETPAGYEDNPHNWYQKLKDMMEAGLTNYKPDISLIPALRRDGEESTNSPEILKLLLSADYIHTGAGSPTYAIKHLKNSLALKYIQDKLSRGTPISIASAVAIAFSKYSLPVYEIYFAGHDPNWIEGLDFFSTFGLNITFLPHWNNTEGGKTIDTRFTYMGEKRFKKLIELLPGKTTIIGIDEHTALRFDFDKQRGEVLGKGSVTVIKDNKTTIFQHGSVIRFEDI